MKSARQDWIERLGETDGLPQPDRPAGMDIARVERMRSEATTIFELTKGFTSKPNRAGQAMLDMAGYVLELTGVLLEREKGQR